MLRMLLKVKKKIRLPREFDTEIENDTCNDPHSLYPAITVTAITVRKMKCERM
jgi:hypothetical protein